MAKIIIRKGFISHGGRIYTKGEVVAIADSAYAKRIVARSGGDFDFYHSEEIPATEEAPTEKSEAAAENSGKVSESDTEADADEAGGELPAIDADADVQTAKGKKK